jgi:hypothetical protein
LPLSITIELLKWDGPDPGFRIFLLQSETDPNFYEVIWIYHPEKYQDYLNRLSSLRSKYNKQPKTLEAHCFDRGKRGRKYRNGAHPGINPVILTK